MAPQANRRPGYSRRAQYGRFIGYVGAVGGILVGGVFLIASHFSPPAFAVMRGVVAEVTTPVSSGLSWVWGGVASVPGAIGSYFNVHGENGRLRAQIAREAQELAQARALVHENQRLRALLQVREAATDVVAVARIVNSTSGSTRRFATLNAGSWQGVRPGQPVREAGGLIGQVVEATPNTARVLLIVDSESIVPARRTRDGFPALVSGRGDGMLEVRAAGAGPMTFQPGDTFVTSGTGGVFPPNIPVARVASAGRDMALATPAASPDTLDFALVQRLFLPPLPPPPPSAAKPKH